MTNERSSFAIRHFQTSRIDEDRAKVASLNIGLGQLACLEIKPDRADTTIAGAVKPR